LSRFYEAEKFPVATVTDCVVAGLGSDGTAIVIATLEHHEAFADAIGAEGVDRRRSRARRALHGR
jgi:hypothetical protein